MASASSSKWTLDYTSLPSSQVTKKGATLDPPCHSAPLSAKDKGKQVARPSPAELDELRMQKAWEAAYAPAKSLPMQAIMMYMTGSGIQIYSLMSLFFLLKNTVSGMMAVEKVFAPFKPKQGSTQTASQEEPSLLMPKLTYLGCQSLLLGVAVWKLNKMGLLPTLDDWSSSFEQPTAS